eukprot:45128-Amphidinium_carterae.2
METPRHVMFSVGAVRPPLGCQGLKKAVLVTDSRPPVEGEEEEVALTRCNFASQVTEVVSLI